MKSFPSTLNEAHSMFGSTKSNEYITTFDIERLTQGTLNLNKSVPVVNELLKEQNINIANYQAYPQMVSLPHNTEDNTFNSENNYNKSITYENPLMLPADIIALAKDYDWVYKNTVKSVIKANKSESKVNLLVADSSVAPSMFNPMYGISVLGITRNTPLLNDVYDSERDKNTSDCSIRTLCAMSKLANSPLGQARYKYADFMYCKDLGKVSNNHLITLRKFAHPIGDHIGTLTSPKYIDKSGAGSFKTAGDVGRLITWFGTDDNKLEDICKYSYHATWKQLDAEIEEKDGEADRDSGGGITSFISNTTSPTYGTQTSLGQAGKHSLWGYLGSKTSFLPFNFGENAVGNIGKNNYLLSNYDKYKVYTPKNTLQSTHIYEGKLEFSQEFTLNFSYQLRAYDNINPRSALLDLLGNILEVTYRRGKFWGGDRKVNGPQQDLAAFDKANLFVDKSFDALGGLFSSLSSGGINMENIMGSFSKFGSQAMDIVKSAFGGDTEMTAESIKNKFTEFIKNGNWSDALKGIVKNGLGRPTLYAWHSLLTGDNVGLWHVTVGNPRNPILSIGNLILNDATVKQWGPLGVDDFPTNLTVSITLKHARPRDITDIGYMYTSGASAIYRTFATDSLNKYFGKSGDTFNDKVINSTDSKNDTLMEQDSDKAIDQYSTVKSYQEDNNEFNIENNINNPFLYTDEHIKIARTNNWNNAMFNISLREVA